MTVKSTTKVFPCLGFVTSGETQSWKLSLSRRVYTIYIIFGRLADWYLVRYSLWVSRECTSKKKKLTRVWISRIGRGNTDKNHVCKVHWCIWKCLVLTHQCGRHHPAIPLDSCRFLEPHRFPRSYSLGDRSLHGETNHSETFSACQEADVSFGYRWHTFTWRQE